MNLVVIALFGLLFVAIFGAKAAQSILKVVGALAAIRRRTDRDWLLRIAAKVGALG